MNKLKEEIKLLKKFISLAEYDDNIFKSFTVLKNNKDLKLKKGDIIIITGYQLEPFLGEIWYNVELKNSKEYQAMIVRKLLFEKIIKEKYIKRNRKE